MSTEADGHPLAAAGEDEATSTLSPHETWLATVGFVAVVAAALAAFAMLKIVSSGGKLLPALALLLAFVTLAGVAAVATGMARAVDTGEGS